MNPFPKGALLAAGTIVVSLPLPGSAREVLFGLLLSFAAAVYVGFAEVDGAPGETRLQWTVALAFVGVALLGIEVSPWFLAGGWLLHAGWDLLHHRGRLRTRTAPWYPPACVAYDLVVAVFLTGSIVTR